MHIKKGTRGKKSKNEIRIQISSAAFMLPSLFGVLIFFAMPYLIVILYSFVDNPVQKNFVFLNNYISAITNLAFETAAKNTLIFSAIAVPLAIMLSLSLALILDMSIPYKTQIRSAFLTPLMVPIASVVLIWQVLFHYNGIVNDWIAHFGIEKIDWLKSMYAPVVIVILFIWKNLGYDMVLFMAALANIPKELVEVAKMEGATKWQVFWKIKIRYLSPTILFVTILTLINSFKVFREVYLLTGDYPFESLYMLQHYMNNTFRSLDYQKLSSAAVLMSLFMVVLIGIMFLIEDRFGRDVEN
jgi:multiple sugar transport system permease protein